MTARLTEAVNLLLERSLRRDFNELLQGEATAGMFNLCGEYYLKAPAELALMNMVDPVVEPYLGLLDRGLILEVLEEEARKVVGE